MKGRLRAEGAHLKREYLVAESVAAGCVLRDLAAQAFGLSSRLGESRLGGVRLAGGGVARRLGARELRLAAFPPRDEDREVVLRRANLVAKLAAEAKHALLLLRRTRRVRGQRRGELRLVVVAARVVGRLAHVRYETRATRVARLLNVHLSSPRMKFRATVHARRGVARRGAESPTARGVTTTSRVAAGRFFSTDNPRQFRAKTRSRPPVRFFFGVIPGSVSATQTVDSRVNRLDSKISVAHAERSPPSVARCCVGTGVGELALIVPEGRKSGGRASRRALLRGVEAGSGEHGCRD